MKKLFSTILVLGLILVGNAYAGSLIPLNKYLQDNDEYLQDPITITYVVNRCSAVYLYVGAITKKKDEKTANQFVDAHLKALRFSNEILIIQMNYSKKLASEKNIKDIDGMYSYYEKDGQDNFTRTGNYIQNSYIGEDVVKCNEIMNVLYN